MMRKYQMSWNVTWKSSFSHAFSDKEICVLYTQVDHMYKDHTYQLSDSK